MIALKKLTLENFQAYRGPAEIEFENLTFLYGPNSVGKSAVFDAITLLALTARGDPRAPWLAKKSRRPGLGDLPTPEISIGAKLFIDGEALSWMESIEIPAVTQASQRDLFARIAEGSFIELEVRYYAKNPESLSALRVTIDDEPILEYEDIPIEYGPYFRSNYSLNPELPEQVLEAPGIRGEWRIHTDHPFASDLAPQVKGLCARSKLVFSLNEANVQTVRGATCYVCPRDGHRAFLPPDHLAFIFPPTEEESDALNPVKRTFYPFRNVFWDRQSRPKPMDEHCEYLSQFSLEPDDGDVNRYRQFLAQECDPRNSSILFSDLRDATTRIDEFLTVVMAIVAGSLEMMRVPGNRSAVDSNNPMHLPSRLQMTDWEQAEWTESGGILIWDFAPTVGLHKGERAAPTRPSSPTTDLDTALVPYAWKCLQGLNLAGMDAELGDFPNYCLQKYLHSLSRYRVEMESYVLEADHLNDPLVDESELADTRIAYFTLREVNRGSRRGFSDVGSGLGYVFPVLAVLGEPKISAIEQPELHLHPRAQEELADVFIDAASRGHGVIIESHSEAFLQRISRRMKETSDQKGIDTEDATTLRDRLRVTPNGVGLYFFSPDPVSGTRIRRLRFNDDGTLIDAWPDGMFATDWASGLDRIKLFSRIFGSAEAKTAWPWIIDVEDAEIQEWLGLAWFGVHMGKSFDYLFIGHAAKISEKVLAEHLLHPLKSTLTNTPLRGSDWWQDELVKFLQKDWRPSLGWWFETMCRLRLAPRVEHPAVSAIREHIRGQHWRHEWDRAEDQNMRGMVKELSEARNAHMHTGAPPPDAVARTRILIEDNGRPGLLLTAFGLKRKFGIRT